MYPINYGFVPETVAPNGKEIDAYVLGVDIAVEKFHGICIAVIYRMDDDDDDKLIVVAQQNAMITDEKIQKTIQFHEKYFDSVII